MKIRFHLSWGKPGTKPAKAFKLSAYAHLMNEYIQHIENFTPCEVTSGVLSEKSVRPEGKVWLCDRSPDARVMSSEDSAFWLGQICGSGIRDFYVVIGGPDGFSKKDYEFWKPDLKWSFGPLTLPHELAAIVAMEQIYRAWSILRGMPYHLKH